jgi:hypothetical protein
MPKRVFSPGPNDYGVLPDQGGEHPVRTHSAVVRNHLIGECSHLNTYLFISHVDPPCSVAHRPRL